MKAVGEPAPGISATMIDPVLKEYSSSIKSFAFISRPLPYGEVKLSQLSRMLTNSLNVYAINPNSLADENMMLNYYDKGSSIGVTEQLYTARGS